MGRRSYNPERRAWRGRSYRKGGEHVSALRAVNDSDAEAYNGDMSNQVAKVVAGPHVLYTGTNGRKTAGVTVESLRDEATCRKEGFKHRWDVNTISLQKPAVAPAFGLTDAEARSLVDACLALEK